MEQKPHNNQFDIAQHYADKRQRLAKLSRFLDSAFTIPIIKVRIGFDALIGMIPVVGDVIGTLLASYFILQAIKLKLPVSAILRMLINLGVDFLVGLVPIFGDLFDVSWRANEKNYRIIDSHLTTRLEALGHVEEPSDQIQSTQPNGWVQALLLIMALIAVYLLREPIYDSLSTLPQYLYN